jgi:uncharacterized protein (DUF1015 family)
VNTPVPVFLPFRGTRYRDPDLSAVVAPPYDVIDEEERAQLEAADPHNAVRLILPRPTATADPYRAAAATFDEWQREHVLATDADPALYGYEMRFRGLDGQERRTLGIIGALELPNDPSTVLAHERTLPKARSDRLALLRATRANFDPIWCLSLAAGLTDLVAPTSPPLATATDATGTIHTLFAIDDAARVAALRQAVESAPVVIADGHHRFETACAYRAERPGEPGAALIMSLVVELDASVLDIRAIHRLVHGAPHDLRARLGRSMRLQSAGANAEPEVRALADGLANEAGMVLVDGEGLARLAVAGDALDRVDRDLPSELREVDAARFDVLIRPELGPATLSYRHDALAVASMVDKGAADAAVLLRPVTVEQIRAVAFAGLRMPEKTSFFWPKPRTGMVMRRLGG